MLYYFEVIRYQVYANLKAETSRGGLGILWWVIEPVLYMVTFYLVFAVVLNRGGDDFVPFLMTGLTIWKWFSSSIVLGSYSIQGNASLMRQVYLPKWIFPLTVLLTNTIKFIILLSLFLLFLLSLGREVSLSWLILPVLVLVQFLFTLAISGLLASVYPFFTEIRFVIENTLVIGMFLSGIFFDIGNVTGIVRTFLTLNPMTALIMNYREVLLRGGWPDWNFLFYMTLGSILLISFAYYLIHRFDCVYPKIVE